MPYAKLEYEANLTNTPLHRVKKEKGRRAGHDTRIDGSDLEDVIIEFIH